MIPGEESYQSVSQTHTQTSKSHFISRSSPSSPRRSRRNHHSSSTPPLSPIADNSNQKDFSATMTPHSNSSNKPRSHLPKLSRTQPIQTRAQPIDNSELDKYVKMAVNSGAHLEAKSAFGYTAFARACEYGYLSIAQFLLSKGADINTTNSDGFTPLFYAARDGNIKILQLLLLSGANKYIRNVSGKQAIDYAKEKNIKQILQDYS